MNVTPQFFLILVVCVLCLSGTGCDDSKSVKPVSISPQQQHATGTTAAQNQEMSTTENLQSSWPPASKENIEIAEDFLQKNYYVVFDNSGSMSEKQCYGAGSKIDVSKAALTHFSKLVPATANLGLAVFVNNQILELVQLATDNRDRFISAVNAAYTGGGTPLMSAVTFGFNKLTNQASRQLGYGAYTLVIMTDGLAGEGQDPGMVVRKILDNTPVEIHTIGFCIGEDHSLNIPGRTVFKAAGNKDELLHGLEEVLAESEQFDVSGFGSGE